jgi:hypothetical protein
LTAKAAKSLLDFAREKRLNDLRASCSVCQLPENVRAQMRAAKNVSRVTTVDWLATEYGVTIRDSDLQSHVAAHHDRVETP